MNSIAPKLLLALTWIAAVAQDSHAAEQSPLKAVPFQDVSIADAFWSPRIATNQTATIEANLHQCEVTGRLKNFAVAGKLVEGKHEGLLFNDSDVYKVIEGIAYTLAGRRDKKLEARTDEIIDLIAAAQQEDGYLNTYYTLVEPDKRWQNIQYGHELYCAGHLVEAAVAYYQATGKRKLVDVAIRFADHIDSVFGPDKRHETCGHQELELALVKLYRTTGERRYLKLAGFLLDMRGSDDGRRLFGEYAQDHVPIRRQREVTGHAVRAMYLYSAMADVAAETVDQGLLEALDAIWHDVADRKMYITGGIGPSAHNEGFTVPYDLPNDSAYAETCAAIGMALWNHRMFLMSGDAKYADVLEREVYNGLVSGVSLTGDRFFYVNPLGSKGQHHRVPWFDCSCCPTNIVRYIPGMGERAYAHRGNTLWTVLYMGGSADISLEGGKVRLTQKTRYPWDGQIVLTVEPERSFPFDLHLRVPGWCAEPPRVTVNGKAVEQPTIDRGYLKLSRTWQAGDLVELELPMSVQRVYADPRVAANRGRVALQRGPVVYCLEGADNADRVRGLCLPREARLSESFESDLLGGVVVLRGEALAVSRGEDGELATEPFNFTAVPYSTWDNRRPGPMVVWLPEDPKLAEIPGEEGVRSGEMTIRASHVNPTDSLAALADGRLPESSGDHNLPRMTWWDHRGGTEWVSCRFDKPRTLGRAAVYWFDDTGVGACRVPQEWRLLWLDGDAWKSVELTRTSSYGIAADQFNAVEFEPITTRELRLKVTLQPRYSAGILEWQVE
ncbi:MAG: beta-L-arabinofuranosidase domain-containing protein [Pirellulales bacterium]